jgi:hypothetical protein
MDIVYHSPGKYSWRVMAVRLCMVGALFTVVMGCHSAANSRSVPHDASFTDLWDTYRHCQKSDDPHEMKADALRLDQSVQTLGDEKDATLVPERIEQFVLDRPSRLAVDPKAMAASCALLAGYKARVSGDTDLAGEMFGHIVSTYPSDRYRYYVVQAYYALKSIAGWERFLPQHLQTADLGF